MAEIELVRLGVEEYVPESDPDFVETPVFNYITRKAFRSHLMLLGPKGAGKTNSVIEYAARQSLALVTWSCAESHDLSELVGVRLAPPQNAFQLGPLAAAVSVANEVGRCILLLDEVNALAPGAQKLLNPLLDRQRSVSLGKLGRVLRVQPDAELWVVMCANPSYGGTYAFNEDLTSRAQPVNFPYPPKDVELKIWANAWTRCGKKIDAEFNTTCERVYSLVMETRTNTVANGYALSTRDMVRFIQNMADGGLNIALKELEAYMTTSEARATFASQVQTAMKIDITKVDLW
jgi:MoxR-like ATPase